MGELSAGEYWSHIMSNISFSGCENIERYEEKLKKVLNDVFLEMDELNRSDPFWEHTNNLPTFYKMKGFATHMLGTKSDARYAWTIIAINLMTGNGHLIAPLWKILQEHNEMDMEFLVKTAWDMAPDSSSTAMPGFADFFIKFIHELGLQNKILPYLTELADSNEDACDWVQTVKKRMGL